ELSDVIVGADEIGLLLVTALVRVRDVRPRMVPDLVAAFGHGGAFLRPALDGEARRKPGRLDAALLEEFQDAARRHGAELAARQRRRRGHAARDEPGLGVEIEGEADDVAGHDFPSITFRMTIHTIGIILNGAT